MEQLDVSVEHQRHARVDVIVGVAGQPHQLANYLRIGLTVEAMVGGSTVAEHLDERAMDCTLPRTVGEKDRSVDVEENESHVRVSRSPVMMLAVPIHCHTVGVSCSITHATITAMIGWTFEYIAVRVGPMTRSPRYQQR